MKIPIPQTISLKTNYTKSIVYAYSKTNTKTIVYAYSNIEDSEKISIFKTAKCADEPYKK